MIRSSTSPIFSPLLLYTALSRMVFLALQPTARTFCSSTVTPSVDDPATCPRAVPPTSAHITLAMTATTMCCCIASPFGLVDCTEHRCCMAVPPGNRLGWRRSHRRRVAHHPLRVARKGSNTILLKDGEDYWP